MHRLGRLSLSSRGLTENRDVNWRKLLDGTDLDDVVAPNRFVSNWVSEREKLRAHESKVSVQRISSRRVVLLVPAQEGRPRKRTVAKTVFALVFATCFVTLLLGLASLFSRHQSESSIVEPGAPVEDTSECPSLNLVGQQFSSFAEIRAGKWFFQQATNNIALGNLETFDQIATCEEQTRHFRVTATKVGESWTIKKMVPVD